MDQFIPLYDSTSAESFVNLQPPKQGLSQTETQQIMQQLVSSIDLHKLSSMYFSQLKNKLDLMSLSIKFCSGSLTIGEMEKASNVKTQELAAKHRSVAQITYGFDSILSLPETTILEQLQRLVKYPLIHALEHYKLKQLAMKDHLTSLGNRGSYEENVARMISHTKRTNEAFGLLVIDLDNFKQVNDKFGHSEGDKVLMAASDALTQSLRDTDFAFRFGGDEFCCLLPNSQAGINALIAKRIQKQFDQHPLLQRHRVSCSIGCTVFSGEDSQHSLFERADRALYLAKQSGRSCCKAA